MLKYALIIDIDFIGVWNTVGALGLRPAQNPRPCWGSACIRSAPFMT